MPMTIALALNIQLGGENFTAGELLEFGSDSTFVDQANVGHFLSPVEGLRSDCTW